MDKNKKFGIFILILMLSATVIIAIKWINIKTTKRTTLFKYTIAIIKDKEYTSHSTFIKYDYAINNSFHESETNYQKEHSQLKKGDFVLTKIWLSDPIITELIPEHVLNDSLNINIIPSNGWDNFPTELEWQ